jgi:acyl dehydratase
MKDFYLAIGDYTSFTKTVSESDVYQFAGITGDFSPNHVNQAYMEKSSYGRLMAHGALIVGFMSTVSTQIIAHSREAEETPVSVGYDKVRFLKPVFLGDTITVAYTVTKVDAARRRSTAGIEVTNQNDELVAVASHILQWVRNN